MRAKFKSPSGEVRTFEVEGAKRVLNIDGVRWQRLPKERPPSRQERLKKAIDELEDIKLKYEPLVEAIDAGFMRTAFGVDTFKSPFYRW